jgi:hypothetical protein
MTCMQELSQDGGDGERERKEIWEGLNDCFKQGCPS